MRPNYFLRLQNLVEHNGDGLRVIFFTNKWSIVYFIEHDIIYHSSSDNLETACEEILKKIEKKND